MPHEITVGQLLILLNQLEPTDLLIPNRVGNFAIQRDGYYAGYIDLLIGLQRVEIFPRETVA